ncbi:uncharacterized protein LOC141659351 isoform X2 [Apium graveolens]|uniref:uncharacterized protein LOC141659351 isoform X2 n=1 Tax=Apium graveolens TaxID=4045 RepID=UPI003D7BA6EA
MENVIINAGKDDDSNVNSLHSFDNNIELTEDAIVLPGLTSNVKSEHLMLLNRIPRQIISFDEQYLRFCLELIKISALRATSCNVPSDVSTFFGQLGSRKISHGIACDWNRNVFESPGIVGANNFGVSSAGISVLGAITGSRSMLNILKSPLLCQMGASDNSVNFGGTNLVGIGETIHPHSVTSPVESDAYLLEKVQKEALVLRDHINGYEPAHNGLSSLSSTNSSCSDRSSSALVSQGMLHCTWNNALPQYVFSIDDQREIYVANLLKVGSPDNKVLDLMYIFHRRPVGQKEDVVHDKESDLVGRMKVTTSSTLLSDNTEIKETQFVLFGVDDDCSEELQTPSHTLKKSLFSKNFFKGSRTQKIKNSFKLGVSSSILENSSSNPCQGSISNLKPTSRISLSKDPFPPNLELAAIVLKTQISYHNDITDLGGWGLKFLKKRDNAQSDASVVKEAPSQDYQQENGDCSTSMDVLIPAGFHGGPRTRNGGPSSLIERWKSGGHCDCGGWDEGCPLTKHNAARSIRTDGLLQTDLHWKSKTFDILLEVCKISVTHALLNFLAKSVQKVFRPPEF